MRRVLIYSSLFPSPRQPLQGLFVSELAMALTNHVEVRVVKPVPVHTAPAELRTRIRRYTYAGAIRVEAPLILNVPRYLKGTDARLMALMSRQAFCRATEGWADLVHAHFAYPDASAAARLASIRKLPLVVTVHGSDLNVLAVVPARRARVQRALQSASAVIAVAQDLARKVVALGVPEDRVHHIPNGVDLEKFSPGDRAEARSQLGLPIDGRIVLAVGGLVPVKAYDRLIGALPYLDPDTSLMIAGNGPEREFLARLAGTLGVSHRVRLLGGISHDALCAYYRAADLLAISSHSEGWPTVIHEAMACATPVVANPVGGIPEAIGTRGLGLLTQGNSAEEMGLGIRQALETLWDERVITAAARAHSWDEIARRHSRLYETILSTETAHPYPVGPQSVKVLPPTVHE